MAFCFYVCLKTVVSKEKSARVDVSVSVLIIIKPNLSDMLNMKEFKMNFKYLTLVITLSKKNELQVSKNLKNLSCVKSILGTFLFSKSHFKNILKCM